MTDKDGVVAASASLIIDNPMVAIDPVDESSLQYFEAAVYAVVSLENFNIQSIIA